jgi:hypothetical protein
MSRYMVGVVQELQCCTVKKAINKVLIKVAMFDLIWLAQQDTAMCSNYEYLKENRYRAFDLYHAT